MTISELSESVAQDYTKLAVDGEVSIDPALILIIAEILIEIVAIYQDCNKDEEEAAKSANNPTLFQKLLLRRIVRNAIGNAEYRRSGDYLVDAFLSAGEDVGVESMKVLYEEVNLL